jgi:hypothetical protein
MTSWSDNNYAAANSDRGVSKVAEKYDTWTEERIATLGYLVGSGREVEAIAEELGTTAGNVYRQASRFGLSFRASPGISMSRHTYSGIQAAAHRRGTDTAALVNKVLHILGDDPTLLENIIDDEKSRAYFNTQER